LHSFEPLKREWRRPLGARARLARKSAMAWLGRAAALVRDNVRWIGIALGVAIVSISVAVLVHLLRDIEVSEIVVALKERHTQDLGLAAGFIVLAYLTLTFYDLFALQTIGARHVPYRIAAMASFSSYAIGHNIGATAFSGGAIRYRIYSSWGLTLVDVAKICFVTGLTFWLGNLTVLGFGMSWVPRAASAIDQLSPAINRALGIAALCVVAAYVAWVGREPRTIGRCNWTLTLPSGASTLVQIAIGVVDLSCCSLAMYMLMPGEPPVGFVTFAVVFVSATLLGFASHAPGSLGVFDAAMLVAFMHFDKEDLVAGLLLFRLLYFIVPFGLALTIMAVRETILMTRGNGGPRTPD
jgi:glycosyltransferase 2 family protein